MELHTIPDMPDDFNLFCGGDGHKGTVFHFKEGIAELIDILNSRYEGLPASKNFIGLHGDMIEGIKIDDFRYNPVTSTHPFPSLQITHVVNDWWASRKKILFWLRGQHEKYLWKFGDVGKMMADQLGVFYGGFSVKATYKDKSKSGKLLFKHFAIHGKKNITSMAKDPHQKIGNMKAKLQADLGPLAGDTALMTKAHTHKLFFVEPEPELYLRDDGKGRVRQDYTQTDHTAKYIHPHHRWYGNTGSFLKLHHPGGVVGPDGERHIATSYAEEAEYPPVELGCPVFFIRGRKIVGAKKVIVGA